MGCDFTLVIAPIVVWVSIHAPTWGATSPFVVALAHQPLFQSTHPHGVRLYKGRVDLRIDLFQSTHPHGVRHYNRSLSSVRCQVSIHAPTWGATAVEHTRIINDRRFNPRTHMGCDIAQSAQYRAAGLFQSTHPHGVRLSTWMVLDCPPRFQSTHPHGVRHGVGHLNIGDLLVSIHAPTWGATLRLLP